MPAFGSDNEGERVLWAKNKSKIQLCHTVAVEQLKQLEVPKGIVSK